MAHTPWFEVDKRGLSKLLERRGKQFIIYELFQNGNDEDVTEIAIRLERTKVRGIVRLEVEDDSPAGFKNLSHAFTLFAESEKKSDPEKSGRFNLGEKLVLSLCEEASIASTKGTVFFNASGRTERRAMRRNRGTLFTGLLKLTNAEFEEFEHAARRLLPPTDVKLTFNGEVIGSRSAVAQFDATLPTEIGDAEGVLRSSSRKTTLEVIEPVNGETVMLYELGIPVVEHDGNWHINIGQKVPLNMDRDNVTPSYLGKVRALVTEHMAEHLTEEDANSAWVRDAVTRHGDEMEEETIERLATLRFGEKRVAYDPSDPEANALAVTRGYQLVHGGSMNRAEWDAVRRVGAILPAGQVTPSPKPFSPDGKPLRLEPEEKWTPAMKWYAGLAKRLAEKLMGVTITVQLANDTGWPFAACYGDRRLIVNIGRLGRRWFEGSLASIMELTIHEFAHQYSANHLDEKYHDALSMLGGKSVNLAIDEPVLFARN